MKKTVLITGASSGMGKATALQLIAEGHTVYGAARRIENMQELIEKGGHALNPRGELYTIENIKARLNIRDFMDTLRGSGINTGGPPPLSQSDRKAFADHLDKLLTRHVGNR